MRRDNCRASAISDICPDVRSTLVTSFMSIPPPCFSLESAVVLCCCHEIRVQLCGEQPLIPSSARNEILEAGNFYWRGL